VNVSDQERALKALVDEYRDGECRRILAQAQQECDAVLAEAHREARRRVHEAAGQERERAESRIRAAQAEVQTQRRRYRQRASVALLEAGWDRLQAELLRRWQVSALRKAWVDDVLRQGLAQLSHGGWVIAHPESWPEEEQRALRESVAAGLGEAPRLEADPEVQAGLRITSGGTSLDATVAGLLGDREAVEARLLALIEEVKGS